MKKQLLRWILGVALCLPAATWVVLAAPVEKKAQKVVKKTAQGEVKAPKPEGLAVQHRPVGCVIAGKHPKLDACFTPKETLARARAYFRAGGTPHWYFVEMKPDQPCLSGVLLKPKKSLVGKTLDLYVEGLGKDLETARTAEYSAQIVAGAGDCEKDKLVAGWVPKASVSVGSAAGAPAVPAGFAGGGLSAAAIGGIAAGGAGLAGGGALLATSGSDDGTPTPTTPTPTPSTPTPATPTPSTPTPEPPKFSGVFTISPDPPTGPDPLIVTFNMCGSTGVSLAYKVEFDVDDALNVYTGGCVISHHYSPWSSLRGAPLSSIGPGTYAGRMTVTDVGQDPPPSQSRNFVVTVTGSGGLRQAPEASRRLVWTSELDVPGGSGQVVVNGRSAVFARPGRSDGVVPGHGGVNRFEALLVDAAGPGTWRFDFTQTPSLRPGSLRVMAGSVAQISADSIAFRIAGRSGERIVFTLETDR